MATINSSKPVTTRSVFDQQTGMIEQIRTIRRAIKNGATGFLFAAAMPDGQLNWFAAGDLDDYGVSTTAKTAMRLAVEAQRFGIATLRS